MQRKQSFKKVTKEKSPSEELEASVHSEDESVPSSSVESSVDEKVTEHEVHVMGPGFFDGPCGTVCPRCGGDKFPDSTVCIDCSR